MGNIIAMFRSRNKDNKDVPGYHERTKCFLTDKSPYDLMDDFKRFVERGMPGEMSRLYVSVNTRDLDKVKKALICKMVSDDNFDLKNIGNEIVSIAMKKENAMEKHWLFDFDDRSDRINEFISDVIEDADEIPCLFDTPHGYAVLVGHGFDTRRLMDKWSDTVSLKRDDFLCYAWETK